MVWLLAVGVALRVNPVAPNAFHEGAWGVYQVSFFLEKGSSLATCGAAASRSTPQHAAARRSMPQKVARIRGGRVADSKLTSSWQCTLVRPSVFPIPINAFSTTCYALVCDRATMKKVSVSFSLGGRSGAGHTNTQGLIVLEMEELGLPRRV